MTVKVLFFVSLNIDVSLLKCRNAHLQHIRTHGSLREGEIWYGFGVRGWFEVQGLRLRGCSEQGVLLGRLGDETAAGAEDAAFASERFSLMEEFEPYKKYKAYKNTFKAEIKRKFVGKLNSELKTQNSRLKTQDPTSIHTGAWSLVFSHPRTSLSTPAATSLFSTLGLNKK
jgi:hypothetical protein